MNTTTLGGVADYVVNRFQLQVEFEERQLPSL